MNQHMQQTPQNLDRVHSYYCSPRSVDGQMLTIYDIWEQGGAFDDSITPSTYSPEYRSHLAMKIRSLSGPGASVFSIGCGNAFVEYDLLCAGLRVHAIDCNAEAVDLAARKGIESRAVDYFELEPGALADIDVVYADGFLGHVFETGRGLDRFFEQLAILRPKPGAWLVFSNDAPRRRTAMFAAHEKVEDFWFISKTYLAGALETYGYANREAYYFPYLRPLSGMRDRTICVARVAGGEGG